MAVGCQACSKLLMSFCHQNFTVWCSAWRVVLLYTLICFHSTIGILTDVIFPWNLRKYNGIEILFHAYFSEKGLCRYEGNVICPLLRYIFVFFPVNNFKHCPYFLVCYVNFHVFLLKGSGHLPSGNEIPECRLGSSSSL